jgi:hypothetical protein
MKNNTYNRVAKNMSSVDKMVSKEVLLSMDGFESDMMKIEGRNITPKALMLTLIAWYKFNNNSLLIRNLVTLRSEMLINSKIRNQFLDAIEYITVNPSISGYKINSNRFVDLVARTKDKSCDYSNLIKNMQEWNSARDAITIHFNKNPL